jgi:hypothetical protein
MAGMTAIAPTLNVPVRKERTVSTASKAAAQTKAVVTEVEETPNYVAIYGSTILVVSMLFLLGVGIPAAFVYGNATGVALGVFCALWGGPSFGVMAGSARVSIWYDKHESHM